MNIEQIIAEGFEAVKKSGQENTALYHDFVFAYNQAFPNNPFRNCGSCLEESFYRLETFLNNQNSKSMEATKNNNCQFHIKNDGVPYVGSLHRHVSNATLTDDIAFKMLDASENYAKIFDKMPKDWQEQLEAWKNAPKVKVKPATETVKETPEEEQPSEEPSTDSKTSKNGKNGKNK